MIYLASLPRCGSTYLFRSICGMPQGGSTPKGAQERHGIVKTHRPPYGEPRINGVPDAAVFVFGDVVTSIVSMIRWRLDELSFANFGAGWPPEDDLRHADILGLQSLWESWLGAPFPVMFVRYSALEFTGVREMVGRWIGRSVQWLPWHERSTRPTISDHLDIDPTYADLISDTESRPDLFIAGSLA